jgi:hypothetical protein
MATMNSLLANVIETHGGLERGRSYTKVERPL